MHWVQLGMGLPTLRRSDGNVAKNARASTQLSPLHIHEAEIVLQNPSQVRPARIRVFCGTLSSERMRCNDAIEHCLPSEQE
jgi:hypothetical protein